MKVMKIKLDVLGIVLMLLATKYDLDKRNVDLYEEPQYGMNVYEPEQKMMNGLL